MPTHINNNAATAHTAITVPITIMTTEQVTADNLNTEKNSVKLLNSPDASEGAHLDTISCNNHTQNSVLDVITNLSLHDLLVLLSTHNEYDVFYYLLNKVEIISFDFGKITVKTDKTNTEIINNLSNFLSTHTNNSWHIDNIVDKQYSSYKSKLIQQAGESQIWQEINHNFPTAKITDILLRK